VATFSYSGLLPQTKALISSAQLRNRYNDIKDHINTNNVSGVVFGSTSGAAQYQSFLLDATKLAGTWNHVLRADGAIQLTGVSSLADGDMLYFNGTNLVEVSVGTTGDTLKLSGTTPTWTTVTAIDSWSQKTTDFSAAANGKYKCTSGVSTITLPSPTGTTEFYIKPEIGNSFVTNNVALSGAMNVAGVAAASYTLDEEAIYYFTSDGTDYDVAAMPIER